MANCNYCERQGWPTLDGMCERHYRDLVVFSLDHAVYRASQEWLEAVEKVYKVEMALGFRPLETSGQGDADGGREERRPASVERRSTTAKVRASLPDEDEEVVI